MARLCTDVGLGQQAVEDASRNRAAILGIRLLKG
jgi:hypothetical protein